MNILLIIPETAGTIAHVSHNIYLALKKRKEINIYVACMDARINGLDFDNMFIWKFKNKFPLVGGIIQQFSRVVFLKKLKKQLKIDVSISTLLGCNTLNAMSRCGEKTIGIFHAPLEQSKILGWKSYLACWLSYKTYIKKLDIRFGVSKTIQNDLSILTGKEAKLLYNIHNFNKIILLSKDELDENEAKIFDNKVILYVGNIYSIKGPDRLLKAFDIYKEKIKDTTKLVFIGDFKFEYDKEIYQLINNLKSKDSIYFFGHKANPYKYMSRASVLVSPSRSEGLPGVIIEALSLGLPVVATNSSVGIWEIMECEEHYCKVLKELYNNKYGVITPNVYEDEILNIEMLTKGIMNVFIKNYNELNSFNKERFKEETIIKQLLK